MNSIQQGFLCSSTVRDSEGKNSKPLERIYSESESGDWRTTNLEFSRMIGHVGVYDGALHGTLGDLSSLCVTIVSRS
jgi:hypothetical protein